MKRALIAPLLLLGLAGGSAPAQAGGLHLRLGAFFPRAGTGAENDLFRDLNELFTRDGVSLGGVARSDWVGLAGGLEFTQEVGPMLEVGVHLDGYGRTLDTFYKDFVDRDGREVFQTLQLSIVPFGASLRLVPTRREVLAPYLTAGVDGFYYRYEQFGEFIDFFDPEGIVEPASFFSDGWAFGFHVAAGLRVPLNYDWSLVGELRYQWAETEMGRDLRLNRIDLSGATATLGVHVRF